MAGAFVRESFSPVVAVLSSYDVEAICQKNHLSFCDLLAPFSQLTTEATFKDPANQAVSHTIKHLAIDFRDLRRDGFLLTHGVLPSVLSEAVRETSAGIADAATPEAERAGGCTRWFGEYRRGFLRWLEPGEQDFLRHYVACVLAVSTSHFDPLDQLLKLSHMQHAQQHQVGQSAPSLTDAVGGPAHAATPKWFLPNIFKYYVLVHDVANGDDKNAETLYQSMKMTYGVHACHLLRVNSGPDGDAPVTLDPDPWRATLDTKYVGFRKGLAHAAQSAEAFGKGQFYQAAFVAKEDALETSLEEAHDAKGSRAPAARTYRSESIPHALSSNDLPRDAAVATADQLSHGVSGAGEGVVHGRRMTASDRERVKVFVQEFATRGLLGFVERQMRLLNDQVMARKGVSRTIMSVTKNWFASGGSRGSSPHAASSASTHAVPAVTYAPESGEMQMRRLADLAFLFQHYQLALSLYQALKRQFDAEQAHLHHAAALEMASLCSFMLGATAKTYPQRYMEAAISTYMNTCGKALLAVRAALLSAEMLCSLDLYSEAASQLIRMTSGESDLCSALFLEEASRCFEWTKMRRKYALHLILAGHRFGKANHRPLALRCYRLAAQVYQHRGWSLADDHIQYTIGRQAQATGAYAEAAAACARLLYEHGQQYPAQQLQFFREYLNALQLTDQQSGAGESEVLPELNIPLVDRQGITVYYGGLQEDWSYYSADGGAAASTVTDAACWRELEEKCYNADLQTQNGFRPSIAYLDARTDNGRPVASPCGEPITLVVPMRNPLDIPVALARVHLRWSCDCPSEAQSLETQNVEVLILPPNEHRLVFLSLTPSGSGMVGSNLSIYQLRYGLAPALSSDETSASQKPNIKYTMDDSLVIYGGQSLELRGRRLNNTKQQRMGTDYGLDFRLAPSIGAPAALLKIDMDYAELDEPVFEPDEKNPDSVGLLSCLSGELKHFRVRARNVSGDSSLSVGLLRVAADPPDAVCLTVADDQPEDSEGEVSAQTLAGRVVFDLVGGGSGVRALRPGAQMDWTLVVRAPPAHGDAASVTDVKLLFYFQGESPDAALKHSVRLRSRASLAAKTRCYAGRRGVLMACATLENLNKPTDAHIAEFQLLKLTCVCSDALWTMGDVIMDEDKQIRLNASEVDRVCFTLSKEAAPGATSNERWLTRDDAWRRALPWRPAALLLRCLSHACKLALLWKAHVVHSDGKVRTMLGETWCDIPLSTDAPQRRALVQTSSVEVVQRGLLTSSQEPSEHYPQHFPQVSVRISADHPTVSHDFTKSTLCVIPSTATLRFSKPLITTGASKRFCVNFKCFTGQPEEYWYFYRGCEPALWTRNTAFSREAAEGETVTVGMFACAASTGTFDLSSVKVELVSPHVRTLVPVPSAFLTVTN